MINESLLKIKVRGEKGKRNYSKMAKISNLKSCCIGKFLSFRDSLGGPVSQLSLLRICWSKEREVKWENKNKIAIPKSSTNMIENEKRNAN